MKTEDLYQSFHRLRLYEQIANEVENLVVTGRLESGVQLPSERELAARFGVARGVVREAIKLLAERGLVTVLQGRGTYISEIHSGVLTSQISRLVRVGSTSYKDLNEVRQLLEVGIVGLASERATAEDCRELRVSIDKMDANLAEPDEYIEADLAFHFALARATNNSFVVQLVGAMVDALRDSRRRIFQVPGAPERGQLWHRKILEALERGDASAACEAMRSHMKQVAEDSAVGERAEHGQGNLAPGGDGRLAR